MTSFVPFLNPDTPGASTIPEQAAILAEMGASFVVTHDPDRGWQGWIAHSGPRAETVMQAVTVLTALGQSAICAIDDLSILDVAGGEVSRDES